MGDLLILGLEPQIGAEVIMKLFRILVSIALLLFVSASRGFAFDIREQCTSAVILPTASVTGGPVIWKNRDTDFLSNKVVYVADLPNTYLCPRTALATMRMLKFHDVEG